MGSPFIFSDGASNARLEELDAKLQLGDLVVEVCNVRNCGGNGDLDIRGNARGTGAVLGVGQLSQMGVGGLTAALGAAQLDLGD